MTPTNPPSMDRDAVLSTIRRHAESHRSAAESDAYSAQEAPRLEAALKEIAALYAQRDGLVADLLQARAALSQSAIFPADVALALTAIDAALARSTP